MNAVKILLSLSFLFLLGGCAGQFSVAGLDANGVTQSRIIAGYIQYRNPRLSSEYSQYLAYTILRHSLENNIDPYLMTALFAAESDFDLHAVSDAGAKGFGQLMPVVRRALGVREPFDPHQNIRASCLFIRQLNDQWGDTPRGWDLTLASYNFGVTATRERVRANKPLPKSVKAYVAKINRERKLMEEMASGKGREESLARAM